MSQTNWCGWKRVGSSAKKRRSRPPEPFARNFMNELLDDDLLALLMADAACDEPCAMTQRLDRAPLSFAQQRLWLEQQRAPDSSAYNLPRALRLTGELNI